MSTRTARSREDRVLVQDGRRHHRKTYSRTEFRIGLACLAVLGAVVGWVVWMGAHPDPALFEAPIIGEGADLPGGLAPAAPAPADRGPLPEELAVAGWTEGVPSAFGYDNLYEKINGREGYYKQFGFEMLHFVSLVSDADPQTIVDIELYVLDSPDNARGAAAGERPADAVTETVGADTNTLYRNALYLTRGDLYIRAIGSDESPAVTAQLEKIRDAFPAAAAGAEIPWSQQLFAGELGLDPGSIS
ncbi:MAG: hypothetical protein HKN12_06700, partial [Gemmatimonadetes bacterium]|nr:hypothetical protein [Gemmatimonadota bacterium]